MMINVCLISSQPTSAGAPEKDQRSGTRTFRSWRLNPNIPTVRRRWYCEWDFAPFFRLPLFLSILYWSLFSSGSNLWSFFLYPFNPFHTPVLFHNIFLNLLIFQPSIAPVVLLFFTKMHFSMFCLIRKTNIMRSILQYLDQFVSHRESIWMYSIYPLRTFSAAFTLNGIL